MGHENEKLIKIAYKFDVAFCQESCEFQTSNGFVNINNLGGSNAA